jgi:hypothetical protein
VEAAAINAHNAAVRLIVDQPFRYLRDGNAESFPLIEHYRVDRSFRREGAATITTTYYAHGADCDNALQGFDSQRRGEPWAFRKDIFYFYHANKTRQCILSQDGLPAEWRYRITANYTYTDDRASSLFTRRGKTFEIFDERDKSMLGTIEVATFTSFPVVPLIVAGCGLNSSAAKWQCFWGLMKEGTSIAAGYKTRAADDPQKNPFTPSLVPLHSGYDSFGVSGYARPILARALVVVNIHFMRARAAFRVRSQAATSRRSRFGSSILRSKHWPRSTPISISTMLSQLACFGV